MIITFIDDIDAAYELVKGYESGGAQYSLLKAITLSIKGNEEQSVGESKAEYFQFARI